MPLVLPLTGLPSCQPSRISYVQFLDLGRSLTFCESQCKRARQNGPRSIASKGYKYSPGMFCRPHSPLLFITPQLPAALLLLSMQTHAKNQDAHPGIPDMTPLQLLTAGHSLASNSGRPLSKKKQTKDQKIAALQDELCAAQDYISMVSTLFFTPCVSRH
jgi:hypothetical protein